MGNAKLRPFVTVLTNFGTLQIIDANVLMATKGF